MSSGGMDWAYRMVAKHSLDPLGLAVVLHLGWRDAASQRTDRGIARALGQHASSISKATAKLAFLGLIVRRSGQWVACETVAIVEGGASAPKPDKSSDDGVHHSVVRTTQLGGGAPLSGAQLHHSVGHKRKENLENRGKPVFGSRSARRASPLPAVGQAARGLISVSGSAVASLSPFQRSRILSGQSVVVAGETVLPGSGAMQALLQAVRSESAVNKVGVA